MRVPRPYACGAQVLGEIASLECADCRHHARTTWQRVCFAAAAIEQHSSHSATLQFGGLSILAVHIDTDSGCLAPCQTRQLEESYRAIGGLVPMSPNASGKEKLQFTENLSQWIQYESRHAAWSERDTEDEERLELELRQRLDKMCGQHPRDQDGVLYQLKTTSWRGARIQKKCIDALDPLSGLNDAEDDSQLGMSPLDSYLNHVERFAKWRRRSEMIAKHLRTCLRGGVLSRLPGAEADADPTHGIGKLAADYNEFLVTLGALSNIFDGELTLAPEERSTQLTVLAVRLEAVLM